MSNRLTERQRDKERYGRGRETERQRETWSDREI